MSSDLFLYSRIVINKYYLWSTFPPSLLPSPSSAQPGGGAAAAPAAAVAGGGAGGQQDYSAAWAEYYRQQAAFYGPGGAPGQAATPQQGQQTHGPGGLSLHCSSRHIPSSSLDFLNVFFWV
uniref:Far upstream element-binding protein C-terminal domain-containing protein n=1 Tax=Hucho hucho TaxID=62062 RepID=A0A4W5K6I0_9TELE